MNIRATVKRPPVLDLEQYKVKFLKARRPPSLAAAVEEAREEWQQSLREFDLVDRDMVDYIIFKINAAERRYMFLLEQAKKENVAAW